MSQILPDVLVVDDDPAVRRMLKVYLELEGFLAREASDGLEALSQVQANPPQAILLDIMMPKMDGYRVCRKLREDPHSSSTVIIFLSVIDKADSKINGLEAGADDFLTKPFDPSELMARLKAHLRRISVQKEKEAMLERMAEKLAVMNRRLQEEAATDGLTGLYNRRHFCRRMEEELNRAGRYGHFFSFFLIDLDRFKAINDEFGHPFGDYVLQEFAKVLRAHLRGIDLVARWGGEEFALLLPETPMEDSLAVGERLRLACESFSLPPLPQGKPTFSAGLAAFPDHAATPQELYEIADKALYFAKRKGRNCIVTAQELTMQAK